MLYFVILDADVVTKSKLSGQLNTCSRRIKEISSSDNIPKQSVLEVPSSQLTKSNVSTTFQELRKIALTKSVKTFSTFILTPGRFSCVRYTNFSIGAGNWKRRSTIRFWGTACCCTRGCILLIIFYLNQQIKLLYKSALQSSTGENDTTASQWI